MSATAFDPNKTYDVIIAGAGPAGCVLASRLSEDSTRQVLLIEAGPDVAAPGAEHPDVLDPFCLTATYSPALHWPGLLAQNDAREPHPYIQGYGVGGASNINGMGADRGLPADYDAWCNLGADGWNWQAVLPYFKKLEHDQDFHTEAALHGDDGPMPVRRLLRSSWGPFAAAIGEALQRRGFPHLEDYMSDFREGFSGVPTNCLPDRRVSAAMAYLTQQVRNRSNLQILANTTVERLSFEGKRASGVMIRQNNCAKHVRGLQIIVSCGAIQSPALLLRSGVGPGAQLSAQQIDVVHDLPGVGANLQNHPCMILAAYLRPAARQPAENHWFLQNWLRFSSHHPGCEANDMHLMAFNKTAWHALGARVGTIAVSVLNSYSKGRVRLSSADASRPPIVQFNSAADARDHERLVSGVRFALQLLMDSAVASMRSEIFLPTGSLVARLHRPNAWNRARAHTIALLLDRASLRRALLATSRIDSERLLSDEGALRELVRSRAGLQYHVCGTCRMGRAGDAEAVVDNHGRVHGMHALRVGDASIFPSVPRGYTHFIVLMAAEKLADSIKADWRGERSGTGELTDAARTRQSASVVQDCMETDGLA